MHHQTLEGQVASIRFCAVLPDQHYKTLKNNTYPFKDLPLPPLFCLHISKMAVEEELELSSGSNTFETTLLASKSSLSEKDEKLGIISPPSANTQKPKACKSEPSLITLIVCILGIYGSFLTWSYLQEKINFKNYSPTPETTQSFFKAPLVINIIQSFFAVIIGTLYLSYKQRQFQTPIEFLFKSNDSTLLKNLLLISISSSLSSQISYKSLNHVDYLFYLLAKSCKLIPVMLVHLIIYKSTFPMYKYLVALIITLGVVTFTIGNPKSSKSSSKGTNDGQVLLGFGYLFVSLFMDGLTNSTQDQIFKQNKNFTGGHLMSCLNFLNCLLTTTYTLLFTSQFQYLIQFISDNGVQVLYDVVLFGLLGSIGQIFIFITLEKFNSVVLVTVTVTRKMISMCLSVFLFGHKLAGLQWSGLGLVFVGIFLESFYKIFGGGKKKTTTTQKTKDTATSKKVD